MNREANVKTLSESERYAVWVSHHADEDELIYHVEIENVTLHLFEDEWEEFSTLILEAIR